MATNVDDLPLPNGWVKEYDPNHKAHFYVDTLAQPPRSIWTHPYEDEQYLAQHPEAREKVRPRPDEKGRPPAYFSPPPSAPPVTSPTASMHSRERAEKKGLFSKLKDKAIGTKEEREMEKAEKRRRDEERRQIELLQEQAHRERLAQQRAQFQAQQQQMYEQQQRQYEQQGRGFGQGGGFGQAPYGQPQYAYAQQPQQRRGFGGLGGGAALPLVGGLAGGLLLGDMLGGGFGDGFGDGGGGFGDGGGDFGDGGGGGDFGGD